jgi:DNA gyrase subunit A
MEVVDSDGLMVITDRGVLIRQRVSEIRTIGRVTQGVKLIRLDEKDKISSITRVVEEEVSGEEEKGTSSDNGMPEKETEEPIV